MKIQNPLRLASRRLTITSFAVWLMALLSVSISHADTYNWNGSTTGGATGVNNTWNTSTANWTGFGTVWPVSGTNNDADFAGTAGTVTISGGVTANDLTFNTTGYLIQSSTLTLNGTTPTITVGTGTSTISSQVAGSAGLTKSGSGTLTLSNTGNTFSGGATISGGILSTNNAGNIPFANAVTLANGGTWRSTATSVTGYTNSLIVAAGESGVFLGDGNFGRFRGSLSGVAGNLTFNETNAPSSQGHILDGTSYGTAASGSVITFLNAGTNAVNPRLSTSSTLGAFANSKVAFTNSGGGSLYLLLSQVSGSNFEVGALDGGNANTRIYYENGTHGGTTVTINGTTDGDFAGALRNDGAGIAALIKLGSSTQTLSGTNTFVGSVTIGGGTLSTSSANNIPSGNAITLSNGGTWRSTANANYGNNLIVAAADSGVFRNNSGNSRLNGTLSGVAGSLTFDETGAASTQGLILDAAAYGTAAAGSVITYKNTGSNNVNPRQGSTSAMAAFANSKMVFDRTGTGTLTLLLSLNSGSNFQVGALDGGNAGTSIYYENGSHGGTTVTINGTTDGNFAGVLSNSSAGIGALIKTGSGTQTLSGANTYSGATSITGGKLLVSNTNSAQSGVGTGDLLINGGTLGGSGYLGLNSDATNVTFGANGGTIAPGASTGILTVNGAVDFTTAGTATFAVELNGLTAGTGYDQLVVNSATGGSSINLANAALSVTLGFTPSPGNQFTIINNTFTSGGLTGTFNGLSNNSTFNVGPTTFRISYDGGTNNDVVLTVVPEPSSLAMLLFGAVMMWFVGRKRQ